MTRCKQYTPLRWILILIAGIMLCQFGGIRPANAEQSDPPLPYLADDADVLTDAQRDALLQLLRPPDNAEHNDTILGRIFVRIIPRLPENATIESCATDMINAAPLGDGEPNDRILLLVAIADRKLRIETSREVWELLTDAECAEIIDTILVPQFRKQDFYQGIHDAILAMRRQLDEEESGK